MESIYILIIIAVILVALILIKLKFSNLSLFAGAYDENYYINETVDEILQRIPIGDEAIGVCHNTNDPAEAGFISDVRDKFKIPTEIPVEVHDVTLADYNLGPTPTYESKKKMFLDLQGNFDATTTLNIGGNSLNSSVLGKFIKYFVNTGWDASGNLSSNFIQQDVRDATGLIPDHLRARPWGQNVKWARGSPADHANWEKIIYLWSNYTKLFFSELNQSLWKYQPIRGQRYIITKNVMTKSLRGKTICIRIKRYNNMIDLLRRALDELLNSGIYRSGNMVRYITDHSDHDYKIIQRMVAADSDPNKIKTVVDNGDDVVDGTYPYKGTPIAPEPLGQFWSAAYHDPAARNEAEAALAKSDLDIALGVMGSKYVDRAPDPRNRTDFMARTTYVIAVDHAHPVPLLPLSITFGFENEVLIPHDTVLYIHSVRASNNRWSDIKITLGTEKAPAAPPADDDWFDEDDGPTGLKSDVVLDNVNGVATWVHRFEQQSKIIKDKALADKLARYKETLKESYSSDIPLLKWVIDWGKTALVNLGVITPAELATVPPPVVHPPAIIPPPAAVPVVVPAAVPVVIPPPPAVVPAVITPHVPAAIPPPIIPPAVVPAIPPPVVAPAPAIIPPPAVVAPATIPASTYNEPSIRNVNYVDKSSYVYSAESSDVIDYVMPISNPMIRRISMANQQSKIWMVIIMSRRLNEITGDSKYLTNDYHAALTLIAEFISTNGVPCTTDNIWSQVENWLPINYRFGLIQSSDLDDLYRAHLKYV